MRWRRWLAHRLGGRVRASGLHPSVDSIGPKAEAAQRAWVAHVFEEVPEVVCAWEQRDQASVLLFGPVDPDAGLPRGVLPATYGLGVTFELHERSEQGTVAERLVRAEVLGAPPPRLSPTRKAASDGVLVPLGHTREGVLYLPLLGPTEAGPIAFSGESAPELFESLLLHAAARLGQDNLRALVYKDLGERVAGIANVETFGAGQIDDVRLYLEEEWKRRHALFSAERVHDITTYGLLPDAEAMPVLLLLIGAQAAGEMGLTDPTWPYVLQHAPRAGMGVLVWGDVPTAPRAVAAGPDDGIARLGGPRTDLAPYTLAPVRFRPAILSPDVRAEAAAVLGAPHGEVKPAPAEPAPATIAVTAEEHDAAESAPVTEPPSLEVMVARTPQEPERAIYCLGGLRVEYKGVVVERWRRRDALQLLAFLVAFPEGRATDALLEEIWPEGRPANARKGLNQLVSEVRRRLGGDPKEMPLVVAGPRSYRLDWTHVWADVQVFRETLASAELADDPEPHLKKAVGLYRGDFCKDTYFGWIEPVRFGLERAYIDAALKLADSLIERGALDEAHPIVDRALGIDPYSDALTRRAMVLDARRVGRAAAVERFRRFRSALHEIDVEPEPGTLSLLASIKKGNGQ